MFQIDQFFTYNTGNAARLQLQMQKLPISTLIRLYVISVQQLLHLDQIKITDEDNQLSWKESSSSLIINCVWSWNPTWILKWTFWTNRNCTDISQLLEILRQWMNKIQIVGLYFNVRPQKKQICSLWQLKKYISGSTKIEITFFLVVFAPV